MQFCFTKMFLFELTNAGKYLFIYENQRRVAKVYTGITNVLTLNKFLNEDIITILYRCSSF